MCIAARCAGSVDVDLRPVGHPQVRLVGVALLDDDLRRERRRGLEGLGAGQRGEALEELADGAVVGHVVEVADDERAAVRARPAALAEGDDRVARERPQVLLGAEHRAPERVVAERRLVDELLGDRRRLVLVALDLLDDDAALLVELVGVEVRAAGEVREQVDRLHRRLRADRDVEGDEVVRRVGVERPAERLGGVVDVAVVRVLLAALEDEVLEEVRHPVLLGTLRAGAGVEGREDRDRARAVKADAVQGQAVGQRGGGDRGHA